MSEQRKKRIVNLFRRKLKIAGETHSFSSDVTPGSCLIFLVSGHDSNDSMPTAGGAGSASGSCLIFLVSGHSNDSMPTAGGAGSAFGSSLIRFTSGSLKTFSLLASAVASVVEVAPGAVCLALPASLSDD